MLGPVGTASYVGKVVHPWLRVWLTDITSLIPSRVLRALSADPYRLTIVLADSGFELRSFPENTLLASGKWEVISDRLQEIRQRWGALLTVAVVVPAVHCLVRDKILPRRALDRAADLLRLDIEQGTPFKPEDVYWGWLAVGAEQDTVVVRQILVKRQRVDPIVNGLAQLSMAPPAIEFSAANGSPLPAQVAGLVRGLPPLEARLRVLLFINLAIVGMLISILAASTLYRQQEALDRLNAETTILRKQAAQIRQQQETVDRTRLQIGTLRKRKRTTAPLVEVWEELTRRLPDTAWIVDLRLDQGTVTIDGYTSSAGEVLTALARSPLFKDVTFSSPVVRDQQRGQEHFQIRARATPSSQP